jgi:DNA polymerase
LCENRRQAVPGHIGTDHRHIVFVGEAPGFQEDVEGEPFVGASGKRLMKAVKESLDLDREQYTILNSVKCRPPKNRDPTKREKQFCLPYLLGQIANLSPCIIITLGRHAAHTLLGNYEPVGELRKKYFVDKSNEIIIVPTLHPAATLYTPKKYKDLAEDLENIKNGAFTVKRVRERCSVNLDEQEDSQGSGDILS